MKRYKIYKNIRKQAVIFGLPIAQFAIMMISVIASLLVIIFSFSLLIIIGILAFNAVLYVAMVRVAHKPHSLQLTPTFPKIMSNKKNNNFYYE